MKLEEFSSDTFKKLITVIKDANIFPDTEYGVIQGDCVMALEAKNYF